MRSALKQLVYVLAALCVACNLFGTDDDGNTGKKDDDNGNPQPAPVHGIVDFWSCENLTPGVTTRDEMETRLGTTDLTTASSGHHYFFYPDIGLKVAIGEESGTVSGIFIHGDGWRFKVGDSIGSYSKYPYETAAGISLDNETTTMTTVVEKYGTPARQGTMGEKDTSINYPRYFRYYKDTLGLRMYMEFYFWGTAPTDSENKPITRMTLY